MSYLSGFLVNPFFHRTLTLLLPLLSLVCLAGTSAAQVPGVKTDLGVYVEPLPPALPRAGGKIVDPTFGTEIMRVTDEADASEAGTAYSYWPTFNRDSTRLVAQYPDGSPRIYEFDPANFRLGAKDQPPSVPATDGGWGIASWEDAIWSGLDADTLYVHRGTAVFAYDAARRTFTKVFDLTSHFPAGSYFFQMSMSRDDDTFAFTLKDASYRVAGYVVYRRSAGRLLVDERTTALDEAQIDKTGRYLVVKTGEQGRGAIEVRVFDLAAGTITNLTDDGPDYAPAHSDNGGGTVIGGDNWMNRITFRRLSAPRAVTALFDFGNDWGNDFHVSMLADDESWALVSFFGSAVPGVLQREIVMVATDGSQRVRRLAHHRSVFRGYLDTPRANISRDGRFVAFTSNWGGTARRDLFVLRAGASTSTPTRLQTTAPVASAQAMAAAMAAAAENTDAQFDALIAAIEQAYAVFLTEQQLVASRDQVEKALRSALLFARAAKALARSGRHPAGVQNRLQIAASRLGQVLNLLDAAAGVQTSGGQAHAPSTAAPPIIGQAATASAATLAPVITPAGLATITGDPAQSPLAGSAEAATRLRLDALQFELAGASVTIGGVAAPLLYASPSRVSFYVPAGLPAGEADIIVTSQDGYVSRGVVTVAPLAPGLFTRDAAGAGVAFNASGESADSFDVNSPRNLSADKRTRVTFFATGLSSNPALNFDAGNDVRVSQASLLANFAESWAVEARAGDGRVWWLPVEFAGAVGSMAGVDQVVAVLHPEMRGAGRVTLTLVAGGQRSNAASINVR